MRIGLVVAALMLLFAHSAWAQACPRGDSKWTDTEYDAWRMLCAGRVVDITPPYGRMEPPLPGHPLPPNVLSAAFLRTILTTEPYASAAPFVHITGAIVAGVFDVTGATIRADVLFYDSHFLGGVVLDEMVAAGTWAFVHSYVPGPFRARGARIAGGFSLAESFAVEGVDLSGLEVGGDVVLRYLETPTLTAPGLNAKAQLDLDHATVATGGIALTGARIGTEATIAPAGTVRAVDLRDATVGLRLRLGPIAWSAPGTLDLAGARIGSLTVAGPLPVETGMPYRQLAAALAAGGDGPAAAAVLRRGLERERREGPLAQRLWLSLRKWTTDYGIGPGSTWRAAALAGLGLVAAATAAWALWRRRA